MQRATALLLAAGFTVVLLCFAAVPAFEIVPLETVSETSSNASIGDLNGDGNPDIVLVKGRHWQLTTKIFLGDGKGQFAPGPPLPNSATKSYSGSLADMTKSGHLDIVLSNDSPDPKLVLVNDGTGRFQSWRNLWGSEMAHPERGGRRPERRRLPGHRCRESRLHVLCLLQRRQAALPVQPPPRYAERGEYPDCRYRRRWQK